jgi:hypothetical protein
LYSGPAEFVKISETKAKGERLDRPELQHIEQWFRSGKLDLCILDDLSRLVRGGEAAKLLGVAVDNGVRVICINDGIDTAIPGWEEHALSTSSENVAHNEHTSRRGKQKPMNRFKKYGFTAARPIVGYIVPAGVTSFDNWQKDESLAKWIVEGANYLRRTLNATATADWLNANKVPTGRMCRKPTWDGKMVRRFYSNTLLMGKPQRGKMHTQKHHETGRRRSVKNPKGPNYYDAPHLAFFDEEFFRELNSALDQKNACYAHAKSEGHASSPRRSRKRTHFPGQHARCLYCGRLFLWGGNGITGHLMCGGSREWRCWNSIGFDGAIAAKRVGEEILASLDAVQGFHEQFANMVGLAQSQGRDLDREWADLRRREQKYRSEYDNLKKALREFGEKPIVLEQINELEIEEKNLLRERQRLDYASQTRLDLPLTFAEVREHLQIEFQRLAGDSFDFGDLLRALVPEFQVFLVQLIDGGAPLPMAKIKLNLCGHLPDHAHVPGLADLVSCEKIVPLFEHPPKHELIRAQVVEMRSSTEKLSIKKIASRIAPATSAKVVGDALKLQQRMQDLGVASPYRTLHEPPANFPKLRRHLNPRYRFEPLQGYVPPTP